jgi:hypothetical protein
MAEFQEMDGKLFINGKEVLKGWESVDGWFWFATEKIQEQTSPVDGKWVNDKIWFGFVQGYEEEWGDFSRAEIESLAPMVWELPKGALPWSGRRECYV